MALNSVPQLGQNLGNTQQPILQNFTLINDQFKRDHVEFMDANTDSGKHNKVSLIQQAYVPGGNFAPAIDLATGVGTVGIYAAQNTLNGGPSRMWSVIPRKTAGAWEIANIPFTESTILNTNPTDGIPGYTWLPSGILIQWGGATVTIANTTAFATANVTFPITFPKAIFRIILSGVANPDNNGGCGATAEDTARTTAGFTITARAFFVGTPGNNSRTFNYIAIGC